MEIPAIEVTPADAAAAEAAPTASTTATTPPTTVTTPTTLPTTIVATPDTTAAAIAGLTTLAISDTPHTAATEASPATIASSDVVAVSAADAGTVLSMVPMATTSETGTSLDMVPMMALPPNRSRAHITTLAPELLTKIVFFLVAYGRKPAILNLSQTCRALLICRCITLDVIHYMLQTLSFWGNADDVATALRALNEHDDEDFHFIHKISIKITDPVDPHYAQHGPIVALPYLIAKTIFRVTNLRKHHLTKMFVDNDAIMNGSHQQLPSSRLDTEVWMDLRRLPMAYIWSLARELSRSTPPLVGHGWPSLPLHKLAYMPKTDHQYEIDPLLHEMLRASEKGFLAELDMTVGAWILPAFWRSPCVLAHAQHIKKIGLVLGPWPDRVHENYWARVFMRQAMPDQYIFDHISCQMFGLEALEVNWRQPPLTGLKPWIQTLRFHHRREESRISDDTRSARYNMGYARGVPAMEIKHALHDVNFGLGFSGMGWPNRWFDPGPTKTSSIYEAAAGGSMRLIGAFFAY